MVLDVPRISPFRAVRPSPYGLVNWRMMLQSNNSVDSGDTVSFGQHSLKTRGSRGLQGRSVFSN